jgi:hypothetical protein
MTIDELRSCTRKELAALARDHQISGWHPMKKDELVAALRKVTRNGKSKRGRTSHRSSDSRPVKARYNKLAIRENANRKMRRRDLSRNLTDKCCEDGSTDWLRAETQDPYWLCVKWNISRSRIERAEAALGSNWHRAVPVIRIVDLSEEDDLNEASHVRDVEVYGDADTWFVRIEDPNRTYQLQIGYRSPDRPFLTMARSQPIRTSRDAVVNLPNGGELARTSSNGISRYHKSADHRTQSTTRFGRSSNGDESGDSSPFNTGLNVEVVVSGVAHREAVLTVLGESVPVENDGSFLFRCQVPDGRHVFPIEAETRQERQTIALAIERNTKQLEPLKFADALVR